MSEPIVFESLGGGAGSFTNTLEGTLSLRGDMAGAGIGGRLRGAFAVALSNGSNPWLISDPLIGDLAGTFHLLGVMSPPPPTVELHGTFALRGGFPSGAFGYSATSVLDGDFRLGGILQGWFNPPPLYGGYDTMLLEDVLALSGAFGLSHVSPLRDVLALTDWTRGRGWYDRQIGDTLAAQAALSVTLYEVIADALALNDSVTDTRERVAEMVDALLLTGVVSGLREAAALITDALVFNDVAQTALVDGGADVLHLADVVSVAFTAFAPMVDALVFGESLSDTSTFMAVLSDTLTLGDGATGIRELLERMDDTLGFALRLSVDNEQYVAWTMSARNRASTRYTNYPFNSFFRLGNVYYGVADAGVYRIGGDDDAGAAITARLRFGMSALGSQGMKRVESLYLGYTATGDMILKVITASQLDGLRESNNYRLRPQAAGSQREGRVKIGRGLKSVYWDFVLENIEGADFELDTLEFKPLMLDRRIRGNAGGA